MLRLLTFIPLLMVVVVLLGVSALTEGSDVVAIVVFASAPVLVVAALGWLMARRARERRR